MKPALKQWAEKSEFCKVSHDGLGNHCARCGSWARDDAQPICPPYVTRCEPDNQRLPHITTAAQNSLAHLRWYNSQLSEIAAELSTRVFDGTKPNNASGASADQTSLNITGLDTGAVKTVQPKSQKDGSR